MVKLKEEKLNWALKQKGKKNKDLAFTCGIKIRRFQQLKSYYKKTGEVLMLKRNRRPKTVISDDEKVLIDKAIVESKLTGAVSLRLYIMKYCNRNLSHRKLHAYLSSKGISKPDKKKQKQRSYCRYERTHSFSLVHLDWHESKIIPGKQVCVVEDDASRLMLVGGEYDNATGENSIALMKKAIKLAFEEYCAFIRSANTDKGSQFYANKFDEKGKKGWSEYELFLQSIEIRHIPSRRNHPQTNGKLEKWFDTYERNRSKFDSFEEFIKWYNNRIHLGLSRKEGITPYEVVLYKLRKESLIGLFWKRFG